VTYPIIQVPDNASTQLEQLGTKAKFWYRDENGHFLLFKQGRLGTGENWAEKVCCEICNKLNIPHADYNLAQHRGVMGTVTPSFVPKHGRLILGNELLAKFVDGYNQQLTYSTNQHTLRRVVALLKSLSSSGSSKFVLNAPIGWSIPKQVGNLIGVFSGYLLLGHMKRIHIKNSWRRKHYF